MERANIQQACHNIVRLMPECGWDEMLESLESMLEFYLEKEEYLKNPPKEPVKRTAIVKVLRYVER